MAERNEKLKSFKTTPIKATERVLSFASNRPKTINEDEPKWDMSAVKRHMKTEIGVYRHANVDLETFAIHAWGVTARQVNRLKKSKFTFPRKAFKAYDDAKPESAMHTPFHTLAVYLLKETIKLLDNSVKDAITPAFWDYGGNKAIIQEGRKRKPDILILWDEAKSLAKGESTWAVVKFILEFKNVLIAGDRLPRSVEAPTNLKERLFKSETAVPSTQVGRKRKHSGGHSGGSRKKERLDKEELSDKYLQLAAYGLEAMSATSRYWVIGLTLDKFRVTVCYMDRFHVVRASSFDFSREPWKLALVLYGMNASDPRQAGFDPCLRALPSSECPDAEETEGNLARPVKKLVGSYFEFTSVAFESNSFELDDEADSSTSASEDEEARGDETDLGSTSASEQSRYAVATPAVTGPLVLRIKGLIRRPDDLVGRGTTVFEVFLRLPDGVYEKHPIVLKQSWVIAKRNAETDIVRAIKKRVPKQARAHLPEFIFSTTSSAEDLGMPWVGMELPLTEENHQVRVLRRIASKHYSPLWKAGNLDKFKKVFVECIQIHYVAYKLGKVLHRDISEYNLMVDLSLSSALGVLNDWDMAKFVDEINDMLTAAHHRTTSTPFLAMDRLSCPDVAHFYRFDLESFFYVLIWAAIHYNLGAGTRDATVNRVLVPWTQGVEANWNHKTALTNRRANKMEEICSQIKPEFEPLKNAWINPLKENISEAYVDYEYHVRKGLIPDGFKLDTLNDCLTFKSFMSAMGYKEEKVKEWAIIPEILDL